MGLDGVELVMEFEDEFEINIEDEVAGSLPTIGDVARFVTWQLRSKWPRVSCPTGKCFYEMRRLLMARLPAKRCDIRPSTRLDDLIPRPLRRRILKSLTKRSLWMPDLQAPAFMKRIGLVFGLSAGLTVGVLLTLAGQMLGGIILGVVTFFATWTVSYLLWTPFAVRFPPGYETVGDLVRRATPNYESQDEIDTNVLERIRLIVSQQMGVPIEKLAPQTNFTHDLHI